MSIQEEDIILFNKFIDNTNWPEDETKELRTIEYDGQIIVISKKMLDEQNAWSRLPVIKALHKSKLIVYKLMRDENNVDSLREYDRWLTELENMLQEAWGFERNSKWHRFWDRPKCECPKLDNDDRYPVGYYIINSSCPLHGE